MTNAPHPAHSLPPDVRREHRPKPVPPEPHRLMANVDTPFGQKVLNVPQRQRVSDIQHRHADHLRRRVETAKRVGRLAHSAVLPPPSPAVEITLTAPRADIRQTTFDKFCPTSAGDWLRGQDLNLRPSGYEPDELPGCSTPRHQWRPPGAIASTNFAASLNTGAYATGASPADAKAALGRKTEKRADPFGGGPLTCEWVLTQYAPALMPGDDLLFQRLSVSTIGAVRFHGRVRDGIGWVTDAMVTKQ